MGTGSVGRAAPAWRRRMKQRSEKIGIGQIRASVLDCASPLALWFGGDRSPKRQRAGAVQNLAVPPQGCRTTFGIAWTPKHFSILQQGRTLLKCSSVSRLMKNPKAVSLD
jgi:hypothetical protein